MGKHKHKYVKIWGIDEYCIKCHEYKAFLKNPELKEKFSKDKRKNIENYE